MTVNNIFGNYLIGSNQNYSVSGLSKENDTGIFDPHWNNTPEDKETISLIAHRGYSSIAPENTLPAFYLAAEKGFTTVECDISWTKDNVPVILHDSMINRTARKTDGSGFIFPKYCQDCTYDELLKYDFGIWKGREYAGTKIPSFDELLQCSKETGLNLYVEIKNTSGFDKGKAQILVDAVKAAGLEDKVTWISFNSDYLKVLGGLMPESRLGLLSSGGVSEGTIKTLDSLKTDSNEVFLDINAGSMNSRGDYLLDVAGYPFETWTVDNVRDIDRFYSYECSGITTNCITESELQRYLDKKN